jgi:hypothetical protein
MNAQAGENNMKSANKTMGPMKVMVSPSILKVNLSHLAHFDTHRNRFVVEAAPVARIVPPA